MQFRAQRPRRPAAVVLLTAAGVGALAFAGLVLAEREVLPSPTTPAGIHLGSRPPSIVVHGNVRAPTVAIARPTFVRIPRLDVQARIRPTGVTVDGVARIPGTVTTSAGTATGRDQANADQPC